MQGPTAASIRSAPIARIAADGGFQDARQGAAPAGMGGADDAAGRRGEQHRRTIGGDDAEGDAGPVRHHRVGARTLAGLPGVINAGHLDAMHLHQPDQGGRPGADGLGRQGTVAQHVRAVVGTGERAVQAGEGAGGDAPPGG